MIKKSLRIDAADGLHELAITEEGDGFRVQDSDRTLAFELAEGEADELIICAEGGRSRVYWARDGDVVHVFMAGRSWTLSRHHVLPAAVDDTGEDASHADIVAPMTGRVVKVASATGDAVAEGDTVVVVEAMKMEHQLRAPFDGRVEELRCEEGQQVDLGDVLARLARIETAGDEKPAGGTD